MNKHKIGCSHQKIHLLNDEWYRLMDNPFNVNDDILRLNETLGYKFDFLDQQSDF